MFEDACTKIAALNICSAINAQKFVRLCLGGSGAMQLSKNKYKAAAKLGRDGNLTGEQIQEMQQCVFEAYAYALGLVGTESTPTESPSGQIPTE